MTHSAMRTYGETLPEKRYQNEIALYPGPRRQWVMKINGHGEICFNRDYYGDWGPDDFAKEVVRILENSYRMKWESL